MLLENWQRGQNLPLCTGRSVKPTRTRRIEGRGDGGGLNRAREHGMGLGKGWLQGQPLIPTPLPGLDSVTWVHADLCQQFTGADLSRPVHAVEAYPQVRE